MSASEKLSLALHPPPKVSKSDNSLKFTDILFGFVIKELFVRLANWPALPTYIQWQLVATSVLVFGSWIGYRRSGNRSAYEVKFVNLHLIRFLIDQLMLVVYFRLAVLSQVDLSKPQPSAPEATDHTLFGILIIFGLYVIWDLLGIWVAACKGGERGERYRYPKIDDSTLLPTDQPSLQDTQGVLITLVAAGCAVAICLSIDETTTSMCPLIGATMLLVLYRIAKEIRTSWRR